MGNTVVWKPSHSQQLAASLTMELLQEAGMPPGVINLVAGHGPEVSSVVLAHNEFAGLHFTGSTRVFHELWQQVGSNLANYRHYPRLVGETGGKDFIMAHPSAAPEVLRTALIRGAFDYQGQKCSAASRAYVPSSLWRAIKDDLVDLTEALPMGDVRDFSNFMGAVIDERAFAKHKHAIDRARSTAHLSVVAGGTYDDRVGWFVRPTIVTTSDPTDEMLATEYFGPILTVHVYPDRQYARVIDQMESFSPYALTGSILAQDRTVIAAATEKLRFAAGNFYINDKPTGAVVGQQPFGGGRASGTNDRPVRPRTCCAGPRRGPSRRPSSRRRDTSIPTWVEAVTRSSLGDRGDAAPGADYVGGMKIAKIVELIGSPQDVFATRATRAFQEAKLVASRALEHEVDIVEAGDRTVITTKRAMSTSGFPEAAKSFVGSKLTIHEVQDWGPAEPDGRRRADIKISIDGAPVALTGTVTVAPAGEGSVESLEGDLKASIPFLGGKIEKLAAPAIEAGFDIETMLLNEWLFGDDQPHDG